MKKYYPVNVDLTGRRCVIVGGGEVAERKAQRLMECGARVTIVSPALTPDLEQSRQEGKLQHVTAVYDRKVLKGAFLVIGATDQADINARVSRDAQALDILVNIVDDPDRCNFILPSLVQRGDLSIAVSTGGKSPALARQIREDLMRQYGAEYETLLDIMGSLRKKILARGRASSANKPLFEALVRSDLLQAIREGDRARAKKIIQDITGIEMDRIP